MQLARNNILKKYGINDILKPFVEELKTLGTEHGYPFQFKFGMYHLRGALLAVLADTPASQAVAGMKESVGGARRKCRHCMATYEQMQEQFLEEQFTLRSKEKHEYQLQKLENAPSKYLKSYYSKAYGINTRSKILEAPHFNYACVS